MHGSRHRSLRRLIVITIILFAEGSALAVTRASAEPACSPISRQLGEVNTAQRAGRLLLSNDCDGAPWCPSDRLTGGPVDAEVRPDGAIEYCLGILSENGIHLAYPEATHIEKVIVKVSGEEIDTVTLFVGPYQFDLGSVSDKTWVQDRANKYTTEGLRRDVTHLRARPCRLAGDVRDVVPTVQDVLQEPRWHHIAIDCKARGSANDSIAPRYLYITRTEVRSQLATAVGECSGPRIYQQEINSLRRQCGDKRCRRFSPAIYSRSRKAASPQASGRTRDTRRSAGGAK